MSQLHRRWSGWGAALLVAAAGTGAVANPGNESKFGQFPSMGMGYNRGSDFDVRTLGSVPPPRPNWGIADDFPNVRPFEGVRTVRWWGSYFNTLDEPAPDATGVFTPVVERGFSLTFYRDIPASPTGSFSRPGLDLGTYVAPAGVVRIVPTPFIGWDQHRVWQYEVDLKNTCLDHPHGPEARRDAFYQLQDPVYWLSISAFNGAFVGPGVPGGPDWRFIPNDDPLRVDHYWGWHTSPENFLDLPTMSLIGMDPNGWRWPEWTPIQPDHMGIGQAFQLFIPTPGGGLLLAMGIIAGSRRRR